MTNEQILKKAIEKAKSNKYENIKIYDDFILNANYGIVFSHDFAKAYWGEEEGYNKVDFIYCKQKTCRSFDSTLTPEDFLKHNSQKELNLLLDKKVHIFGNIDYLGEVTYYRTKEGWQYHQHEMLDYLQEGKEPLKYLEKFLDK